MSYSRKLVAYLLFCYLDVKKTKEEENNDFPEEKEEELYSQLLGCFSEDKEEQSSDEDEEDILDEEDHQSNEESERASDDIAVDLPDPFEDHFNLKVDDDQWRTWPDDECKPSHVTAFDGVQLKKRATFVKDLVIPPPNASLKSLHVSKILFKNISKSSVSPKRKQFLASYSSYADMLYLRGSYETTSDYRWSYCLHVLNHIMKVRKHVLENNSLLESKKGEEVELRDRGITRPRVLIVLPFRESAKKVIETMSDQLSGLGKKRVLNYEKFEDEYSSEDYSQASQRKPSDYNQVFEGNTDDSFRLGATLTKKTLKLYADFYASDIIICSALALRMKITGDKDFDFLSSIEIVIFDQIEVLFMQNWEHVIEIMTHLNLQPKQSHDVDFNRVKMSFIEGRGKFYRQTLMFGSVNFSEAFALLKHCNNVEGQLIVPGFVTEIDCTIRNVCSSCPQTFRRYDCSNIDSCADERFKFFTESVLPLIRSQSHVLIYISCYFDFVRIRNYFRKEDVDFVGLCEYTKEGKIAEARAQIFHESRRIMLYTERFHFYRRFQIKGVRHVLFYQLPTIPTFYPQICNLAMSTLQGRKFRGDDSSFSVSTIFCKYDGHRLAGVLGTDKAALISRKKVFNFVSDSIKLV